MSDINETWISSTIFDKYSYQILWKSVDWGAEFFHADGRTDVTKRIVTFRKLANSLEIGGRIECTMEVGLHIPTVIGSIFRC